MRPNLNILKRLLMLPVWATVWATQPFMVEEDPFKHETLTEFAPHASCAFWLLTYLFWFGVFLLGSAFFQL